MVSGIMHANVVWGTPLIDAISGTNDDRMRKHLAYTWGGFQLIQYARLNLIEWNSDSELIFVLWSTVQ